MKPGLRILGTYGIRLSQRLPSLASTLPSTENQRRATSFRGRPLDLETPRINLRRFGNPNSPFPIDWFPNPQNLPWCLNSSGFICFQISTCHTFPNFHKQIQQFQKKSQLLKNPIFIFSNFPEFPELFGFQLCPHPQPVPFGRVHGAAGRQHAGGGGLLRGPRGLHRGRVGAWA